MEDVIGGIFSLFFSLICCGAYIIPIVLSILGLIGWIFMLIHVIQRDESSFKEENGKLLWLLIILLTGWIGALVYYFMEYRKVQG